MCLQPRCGGTPVGWRSSPAKNSGAAATGSTESAEPLLGVLEATLGIRSTVGFCEANTSLRRDRGGRALGHTFESKVGLIYAATPSIEDREVDPQKHLQHNQPLVSSLGEVD